MNILYWIIILISLVSVNSFDPITVGSVAFGATVASGVLLRFFYSVNGDWSNWSDFSSCTKLCGGGEKSRTRICNNPEPSNGGKDCVGKIRETEKCNTNNCIVNGGWSNWSDFSSCTKTCGGGEKSRTRKCNNPEPRNGGKDCFGEIRETQKCNNNYCIVNGDFNNWSDYSTCTKSCEGGTQVRTRECNKPKPENGGLDCVGFKTEARSCNKHKCDDYCSQNECCSDEWVYPNIPSLESQLNEKVFGQHLVNKLVSKAVKFHVEDKDPKKPLVISFHGWTGTGKTFVSQLVAKSLFKNGTKSKYFHKKIATVEYMHAFLLEKYKTELIDFIKSSTKNCSRSFFIFDEFDKMPKGLADVMNPFLDFHDLVEGQDYRKNIFFFLSNTADDAINNHVIKYYESNKSREEITSVEMEKLISDVALNSSGGFQKSSIITDALIDFYVPFLPLERKHVKQCAEAVIKANNYSSTSTTLEDVANEMIYFPDGKKWFSVTGCKSVGKKVTVFL